MLGLHYFANANACKLFMNYTCTCSYSIPLLCHYHSLFLAPGNLDWFTFLVPDKIQRAVKRL